MTAREQGYSSRCRDLAPGWVTTGSGFTPPLLHDIVIAITTTKKLLFAFLGCLLGVDGMFDPLIWDL